MHGAGHAHKRSRQSCWDLGLLVSRRMCCYSLCLPVMVTVSLSLAAWLAALTTTRLDLHAWPEQEKGCGPRRCVGDLELELAPAVAALPLCTGVLLLLLHCLPNALAVCCLARRPGAVCSVWHCILCLLSGVWLVQRGLCEVESSYQNINRTIQRSWWRMGHQVTEIERKSNPGSSFWPPNSSFYALSVS